MAYNPKSKISVKIQHDNANITQDIVIYDDKKLRYKKRRHSNIQKE